MTDDLDTNPRLYRVGTLVYTRSVLFQVFFWMLWGDFCLNLMESVIPRMVPLQLASLGASNALIGLLTGSVLSLLNWFLNPVISTWSDRHRSALGRRRPFLLYPTPVLAFFLILVGFAGDLVTLLNKNSPAAANHLAHLFAAILPDVAKLSTIAQLTIGAIGVLLILYKLLDMFPQTAYYYLFADVIPQQVMGKFVCLFRVFATAGGVAFHYWLLQYATTHPRLIYISCGLLYLVAFLLLSMMVKEGEYPPPPPRIRKTPPEIAHSIIIWFRESFSFVFYWKYFLSFACFRWAFVPFNAFLIVYANKSLNLSPEQFGHALALVMAVQMPILLALGPLVDRFHPVRICMIGYVLTVIAALAGFYLIHDQRTFLVFTIYAFAAVAILQSAIASLGPRILPRQRYGQFCAANAMVGEGGLLFLSWLCGKFLDVFGLRCLYLWFAFFSLLGIGMIGILYFGWKAHGGDENYCAPGGFD